MRAIRSSIIVVGFVTQAVSALTGSATLPRTTSHVWLAPRHVRSTSLMTPAGEAEQYLFYRGVAHLDALVQTELAPSELRLRAPANLQWLSAPATTINALWLVDIRPNGGSAFREIDSIVIAKDAAGRELRRSRRHAGDVGRELLSLAGVASPLHRAAGIDRVPLTRGDFDSARAHEGVGRANRSGAAVASGRSRRRRIAACRAHHGREPQNERNDRARARRAEEGKPNEDCRANADEADSQQCK
jgi:hypothetical protein